MTTAISIATIDLGATSGRVMLVHVEGGRVSIRSTGRFANTPLMLPDGIHCNIPALHQGALDGLTAAFRDDPSIASVGINSWAFDYGMLRGDSLIGLPFHYRDQRSLRGVNEVHASTVAQQFRATSNPSMVADGSHDTASTIAPIPLVSPGAAYISCETWGLVGLELNEPVRSDESRNANFMNERATDGRVRFLTNAMGLWLLSESIRTWEAASEKIDLPELLKTASAVTTPVKIFDANEAQFHAPGDQPARVREWCAVRGLRVPADRTQMVSSIVESLAESFANAVRAACTLAGANAPAIHIVGGGSLNELLCQSVADRSGLPVLAGPVEATAIGNVLVQAKAAGVIGASSSELREVVHHSVETRRHEPCGWRESR
jgi:sugar (pentulose or hexulose) kinase